MKCYCNDAGAQPLNGPAFCIFLVQISAAYFTASRIGMPWRSPYTYLRVPERNGHGNLKRDGKSQNGDDDHRICDMNPHSPEKAINSRMILKNEERQRRKEQE